MPEPLRGLNGSAVELVTACEYAAEETQCLKFGLLGKDGRHAFDPSVLKIFGSPIILIPRDGALRRATGGNHRSCSRALEGETPRAVRALRYRDLLRRNSVAGPGSRKLLVSHPTTISDRVSPEEIAHPNSHRMS